MAGAGAVGVATAGLFCIGHLWAPVSAKSCANGWGLH